ncbi:MAG: O-antigen ligase family protein [bacterium]|nr:O-antigen ligase family protein [bacterium]
MIIAKTESFFWKITEWIFYIFFAVFPFINYKSYLYTGTSTRAINLIFVSSILGVGFALWYLRKKSTIAMHKNLIFGALGAYFLILCISALGGINSSTSFWSLATRMTGLWYFLNLGFFMVLLSAVIIDRTKLKKMIIVIVFSTALYSFLSFLSPEGIGFIFTNYTKDGFSFGNSTFAGMYIFGAFLLSLYYFYQSSAKKWWMYFLPLTIIINPNIINREVWFGNLSAGILGEARASAIVIFLSILGLFVILLISKIKDKTIRTRVSYSLFGLACIVMAFSVFSLLSPNGYLRNIYLSQATAARPVVWEIAQKSIQQNLLLGWGTDNFERAFEQNYDNRLLQNNYGAEAWFDRAHNIFVDQLVDNGVIGTLAYIFIYSVIILSLMYVALNSTEKNDRMLASILIIYFSLHLVELQTAFDTSISYIMIAFMITSAAVLLYRTQEVHSKVNNFTLDNNRKYFVAIPLLMFFVWSLIWGVIPFARAQSANGDIRKVGSAEKRIPLYNTLLGSNIDPHSFLWRTTTDFERGIADNPKVLEDKKKVEMLKREIIILENEYKKFIQDNPLHFRAHLNLADILIYQRLFEVDKLEEAQKVLDRAIVLVPQSPQPYWMKAVGYIYMRDFDKAREYAKKGYDLNPNIEQSAEVIKYVEESIKNFPDIDLYFFRQI